MKTFSVCLLLAVIGLNEYLSYALTTKYKAEAEARLIAFKHQPHKCEFTLDNVTHEYPNCKILEN